MKSRQRSNKNLKQGPAPRQEVRTQRSKSGGYKSTRTEIERRINIIERMLLAGLEKDIVRYCADNFGINARQSQKYKKRALKNIRTITDRDRENNIARAIQMATVGYNQAMSNVKAATAGPKYLDIFCKITGVYEPQRFDGKVDTGIDLIQLARDGLIELPGKREAVASDDAGKDGAPK
ncbi:hypothetical protein QMN07_15355 [Leptospira santarosai]|uniref:hypothetical protein n=1 Tax=Leptospira santarosai TaxID=28183 RepID=UPI0024AFE335|nr:hypothetical protein [Leptospira santarosai]MDI7218877.1 hypothetical protein [Leptospira santarosai]